MKSDGKIRLHSGILFSLSNPDPKDIRIEDIAHNLSHICRYTGAVRNFYSVAQHSYYVSLYCDPAYALHGLLHDASEAYLSDISSPLKHLPEMAGYRELEARIEKAICTAFGLDYGMHPSVKEADERVYLTESRDLMPQMDNVWYKGVKPYDFPIDGWIPELAKMVFMERFNECCKMSSSRNN